MSFSIVPFSTPTLSPHYPIICIVFQVSLRSFPPFSHIGGPHYLQFEVFFLRLESVTDLPMIRCLILTFLPSPHSLSVFSYGRTSLLFLFFLLFFYIPVDGYGRWFLPARSPALPLRSDFASFPQYAQVVIFSLMSLFPSCFSLINPPPPPNPFPPWLDFLFSPLPPVLALRRFCICLVSFSALVYNSFPRCIYFCLGPPTPPISETSIQER